MRTDYVVTRPVRNRFLVRQRDRRRLTELVRLATAMIVVGAALLAYTSLHLQLLGIGYEIDDLEQELKELHRTERHLQLEAAYLSSPGRVERRATAELGMAAPTFDQVRFLEAGAR